MFASASPCLFRTAKQFAQLLIIILAKVEAGKMFCKLVVLEVAVSEVREAIAK
jgi:hypothetical protein